MKLNKMITTLTVTIILAFSGSITFNFNRPDIVKAFNIGFKNGIPKQFKHSWIGKETNSDSGSNANFIVKNGNKYKFITNYWDQNGRKDDSNIIGNYHLRYSLQVRKNQYLLAAKTTEKKQLVLVKFTSKRTMQYSFAKVTKNGKLYRISDNFKMTVATKNAAQKAVNDDSSNNNDNSSNNQSSSSTSSSSSSQS